MNRYEQAFAAARAAGQVLVMPYVTTGFPTPGDTVPVLKAVLDGGAGSLEVGVPFSDPLADGPTIQHANTIALRQGASLGASLEAVRELRAAGYEQPITLMGYLNPFLARAGADAETAASGADLADRLGAALVPLAGEAAAAGVDGLIVVDLPVEESDGVRGALQAAGLELIYLLAPTSTEERIQAVAERAGGFVYLVSVTGVTGAREALPSDLADFVARVRSRCDVPLALGFGISSRAQVETVGELCEAAVIGSALISELERAPSADRAAAARSFAEVVTGRRKESGT